jgi:hypothetical protein
VKSKRKKRAPAGELYTSTWFRLAKDYALSLHPDLILILSAKYGVLDQKQTVAPYDYTLNGENVSARKRWASRVLMQLRNRAHLDRDKFTIFAGERYCEFLVPQIKHCPVPMRGLRQGEQLRYLKERLRGAFRS